jgi:hypothetical protein
VRRDKSVEDRSGGRPDESPLLGKVSTPPRPRVMGFASWGVELSVDRGNDRLSIELRNPHLSVLTLLGEGEGNTTNR